MIKQKRYNLTGSTHTHTHTRVLEDRKDSEVN